LNKIIKKFKAVAQECGLRIIFILLKSNSNLCICEMMDVLQKEQYNISRCLGILKEADLINEQRDGRLLLYSLNNTDPINKKIFESILNGQHNKIFNNDLERLNQRLNLRENGKVVVTYNK
jgi:ArsR family transcriptional regulator